MGYEFTLLVILFNKLNYLYLFIIAYVFKFQNLLESHRQIVNFLWEIPAYLSTNIKFTEKL